MRDTIIGAKENSESSNNPPCTLSRRLNPQNDCESDSPELSTLSRARSFSMIPRCARCRSVAATEIAAGEFASIIIAPVFSVGKIILNISNRAVGSE